MNVLSLFDGISTGRLALDMAGIQVDRYFSSEVEPAPMAVSAKRWPDVEQIGDCRRVKAQDRPGDWRKPVPGVFQGGQAPEL